MQKNQSYTVSEAQKKVEYYCTYQERCHHEVIRKLREMNMIPQAIDIIMGKLIEGDYLNETRFAQHFSGGKFRIKKWGKERILRELKRRNISDYNIKLALSEISEEDYYNTAKELADKFWRANSHRSFFERRKKVVDALRYRGWESGLIYELINTLTED